MDSINILIDYFSMFKKSEISGSNDAKILKKIDDILHILNETKDRTGKTQYLTDFNMIEEIVKKYDVSDIVDDYLSEKHDTVPSYVSDIKNSVNKGLDNVLYDVFYNLCRYNNYLSNKKVKSQDLSINADISFDSLDVKLKDVLNYLDIKDDSLDKSLIDDLSKMVDLNEFKEFAIAIKTDNGMRRVLFDKIEDKNVLVSILLHSNLEIVDSIIKIFENENANLTKVVSNIPSIFIKDLKSSKCKYKDILTNYNNFNKNYSYLKENDIDFKKMLNFPVFFINDFERNMAILKRIDSLVEG